MSTRPPNQASGPGSPGDPPARQDARALLRAYYESLPELPKGTRLETDVIELERRNGPIVGYTRDELITIAREIRTSLRQERNQAPDPGDQQPPRTSSKWDTWLTRIGFGVFVLAAVGLSYYAISIKRLEPNWENFRPYIIGISGTGILLLLLSFGRAQIDKAGAPPWLGPWLTTALAVLFVIIVAMVAIWFGVLILQDAGILPKPDGAGPVFIPAPKAFVYEACQELSDPRLPDDSLGRIDDDRNSPRQWMWSAQDNAEKQLGKCVCLWLLTETFEGRYPSFVAHVNVAVPRDVIVSCHLLQPQAQIKHVELNRSKATGKDEVLHYFLVQQSHPGDRLLVFVAMQEALYKNILHDPKFKITTR